MISGKTAHDIFLQIRHQAITGQLQPGDTLPPVRDLAEQLGINRNTVASAYKKLVRAGIAVSRGRNGTSVKKLDLGMVTEGVPMSRLIDASGGNPDPELLPDLAELQKNLSLRHRLYGEPVMNSRLEQWARDWLAQDLPHFFTLCLTHGAVDAIERLLMSYLVSGDKVAVETPCFLNSIQIINANGFELTGVEIDNQGMIPSSLVNALDRGAQAVVITPRAHNPTGCSLSAQRADEIKSILQDYSHVMVIVDDHFSMLSVEQYQNVIPDNHPRWALIRSMSKIMGPDIRLAFVASDAATSALLQQRLAAGINWISHIIQDLVAASVLSPQFADFIAKARNRYQQKRLIFNTALLANGIDVADVIDGFNLWLPLASESSKVVMALAHRGWMVREGEVFGIERPIHGIRITLSMLDERQLLDLAQDIADVINLQ
jgi:DNA-binding transcriptional MocR family regulator